MATTLKSVLERVVGTLNDDLSVTWTLQDLVRYLNDGQRDMHVWRPDLFHVELEYALAAGVKQTLPAGGSKLIDITANAVGTSQPITRVQRALLDAQLRGWRTSAPSLEIDHFLYDERQPKSWECYPPAMDGSKVWMEHAVVPVDLPIPGPNTLMAAVGGNINVPDLQSTALQHYICFRCYAEGSEPGNAARASAYIGMFAEVLGIELKSITDIAPSNTK